jgi:hypothetical protein
LLLAQDERAHDVHKRQHSQHKDDDRRNVEERFAFHKAGPMRNLSYAASPLRRKPHCRSDQRKREGFRPPLSRVAGLLPRLDGLVTSLASPWLPTLEDRDAELGHRSTTWIDADHKGPAPTLPIPLSF